MAGLSSRTWWLLIALAVGQGLSSRALLAAPEVRYFFPPGVQRGQNVETTATGKFEVWPVRVWIDRPGLEVTPLEKNGQFAVRAAADARPGTYWIRLYDETGSGVPRPLIVGTVPEVTEVEPNDKHEAAQPLGDAAAATNTLLVNAQLNKGGDVDLFAIPAKAGQWLVADLDAQSPLDSPMDAVLQIVSADGFVQAQNEDHLGLDPRLAFQVPRDGIWHVRVFGFPSTPNSTIGFDGGGDHLYRLLLTTGPYVDATRPLAVSSTVPVTLEPQGWNLPANLPPLVATPHEDFELDLASEVLTGALRVPVVAHESLLEVEPSSLEAPQTVPLPVTITGRIDTVGEKDVYAFAVEQGTILSIHIESRGLGYDLDPVLELLDADGKALATADDIGELRDAELTYTATAAGTLRVVVADRHRAAGERFVYRLTIERALPEFRLSVGSHEVVLAAGATVEVPVTIERRHGFAEAIAVTADQLPAGVTVEAATSQASDDSKAKVTLKLTAAADAPLASQPIRITGRVGEQSPQAATITVPGHAGAKLHDLWLTVSKPAAK
ncbi:MAG: PPC domain-containing protein [Pirellulales bacterium]|nr:PPC domain-containing protein [Pirellulales bacterium]